MQRIHGPEALRDACRQARAAGQRVAVIPTMGALHAGHMALVSEAHRRADFIVLSIFVNPTQFGPGEDLARYPRTYAEDCVRCEEAGVHAVFAPDMEALYRPGDDTRIVVAQTASALCGSSRPGHFEGVATIVAKLLNLCGQCIAVFGRKDYQQYRVIERMVDDLFMPVSVVGVATVREADGLALSSRNRYLTPEARQRALAIPRGLSAAAKAFDDGERQVVVLEQLARQLIAPAVDSIDYLTLADPHSTLPLSPASQVEETALLAVAARIDDTRLIDNLVLGEDNAQEWIAG